MGKLVVSTYVTLDGVMQPIDWTGRYSHEDHGRHAREVLFASDALVMGRETYEVFAPAWSSRTAEDEQPGEEGYVERINSMPKFVASTTLKEPLGWNNSTLIRGDVVDAVSGLKERFRGNVLMYGCGPLARADAARPRRRVPDVDLLGHLGRRRAPLQRPGQRNPPHARGYEGLRLRRRTQHLPASTGVSDVHRFHERSIE
jgi:dihydrofolate reductase